MVLAEGLYRDTCVFDVFIRIIQITNAYYINTYIIYYT